MKRETLNSGQTRIYDGHGSMTLSVQNLCLFVHDLVLDGRDPSAMVRFASEARKFAWDNGYADVWLHVDIDNPRAEQLIRAYKERWSAEPKALIMRVALDLEEAGPLL